MLDSIFGSPDSSIAGDNLLVEVALELDTFDPDSRFLMSTLIWQ